MEKTRDICMNTLSNEVIRIDFLRIKDIQCILDDIQIMMKDNHYTLRSVDIRNVNINIDDPQTLVTQEMIKSNIDTTINYEYLSDDENHKFVLNEYFLIFEKNNFENYGKIEKYLGIMKKIIKTIVEKESEIQISRIGIRKVNQIFIKDIDTINKYINANIPLENKDKLDEYSIKQKVLDNDVCSSNINLYLKRGKGSIDGIEKIRMYRYVWDIDCYKRDINKSNIINEIININEQLFDRYVNIITNDLYRILSDKEINIDKLTELGIYGGINKNE